MSVVEQGLSKAEAARRYDVSWRWVHTLVTRYEAGGLDALEPRSRRPATNPNATRDATRARILELRRTLTAQGLDAGPATIAWHLDHEHLPAPAISTVRRILTAAALVTPEPRKRPRSSLRGFEAEQPNETWQSDFTHWRLADGTDTEVFNWADDHSRLLLWCTDRAASSLSLTLQCTHRLGISSRVRASPQAPRRQERPLPRAPAMLALGRHATRSAPEPHPAAGPGVFDDLWGQHDASRRFRR